MSLSSKILLQNTRWLTPPDISIQPSSGSQVPHRRSPNGHIATTSAPLRDRLFISILFSPDVTARLTFGTPLNDYLHVQAWLGPMTGLCRSCKRPTASSSVLAPTTYHNKTLMSDAMLCRRCRPEDLCYDQVDLTPHPRLGPPLCAWSALLKLRPQ